MIEKAHKYVINFEQNHEKIKNIKEIKKWSHGK